jgi:transposase
MLKIDFTIEQIQALQYQRFHHPHPRVQRKMEALLLKSQGLRHSTIAHIVGISPNTLTSYLHQFQKGGLEALKQLNFYRPSAALDAHRESLDVYFQKFPVASINHARAEIEKRTGILRSPTQIRQFLLKLGLKRRKVGAIPANAKPEEQASFLKNELEPRLAEAKTGNRQIFLSMPLILS